MEIWTGSPLIPLLVAGSGVVRCPIAAVVSRSGCVKSWSGSRVTTERGVKGGTAWPSGWSASTGRSPRDRSASVLLA
jgi:hypothetical protein